MRAAHAAEVGAFGTFLRQCFVVELSRGNGVEGQIELVFPTEFESGFAEGVVAVLRAGVAFR